MLSPFLWGTIPSRPFNIYITYPYLKDKHQNIVSPKSNFMVQLIKEKTAMFDLIST